MKNQTTDHNIGATIAGKYRLLHRIGVGAMGSIYRAEQITLGKTVAIKLLHAHMLADPTLSKRFHREARAAARLSHPNTITIYDFGTTDEGSLYIAMEYIDGRDLAQLLHKEFPIGIPRIIHILKQVCSALDEAHEQNVIHRDLKPENIMVMDTRHAQDMVKVLDFGIAKIQDRDDGNRGDSFQTMAGIVCGTPEFMSPEQARGETLDARTDIYSMGVLLYQLLTNHVPFSGESPLAVVTKHLTEPAPSPRMTNPDIPNALDSLVLQLLDKKRENRPQTALALKKALERIEMTLGDIPDTVQAPRGQYLGNNSDISEQTAVYHPVRHPAKAKEKNGLFAVDNRHDVTGNEPARDLAPPPASARRGQLRPTPAIPVASLSTTSRQIHEPTIDTTTDDELNRTVVVADMQQRMLERAKAVDTSVNTVLFHDNAKTAPKSHPDAANRTSRWMTVAVILGVLAIGLVTFVVLYYYQ
ncbi:MAG: serine/threonine protein kinase [Myxococcales bacterium]|nr:serine/threonine protein kinase [Myxococcales bacterium]